MFGTSEQNQNLSHFYLNQHFSADLKTYYRTFNWKRKTVLKVGYFSGSDCINFQHWTAQKEKKIKIHLIFYCTWSIWVRHEGKWEKEKLERNEGAKYKVQKYYYHLCNTNWSCNKKTGWHFSITRAKKLFAQEDTHFFMTRMAKNSKVCRFVTLFFSQTAFLKAFQELLSSKWLKTQKFANLSLCSFFKLLFSRRFKHCWVLNG